jgi:hypothetical protein
VKDGRITWRPNKTARSTDKVLSIRILPELQAALSAMPARDTSLAFVLNDYGKPFASPAAFGNKFADWCKDTGLKPVLCADGRVIALMVCARLHVKRLRTPDAPDLKSWP